MPKLNPMENPNPYASFCIYIIYTYIYIYIYIYIDKRKGLLKEKQTFFAHR